MNRFFFVLFPHENLRLRGGAPFEISENECFVWFGLVWFVSANAPSFRKRVRPYFWFGCAFDQYVHFRLDPNRYLPYNSARRDLLCGNLTCRCTAQPVRYADMVAQVCVCGGAARAIHADGCLLHCSPGEGPGYQWALLAGSSDTPKTSGPEPPSSFVNPFFYTFGMLIFLCLGMFFFLSWRGKMDHGPHM